jgi:hypothetical protein
MQRSSINELVGMGTDSPGELSLPISYDEDCNACASLEKGNAGIEDAKTFWSHQVKKC